MQLSPRASSFFVFDSPMCMYANYTTNQTAKQITYRITLDESGHELVFLMVESQTVLSVTLHS